MSDTFNILSLLIQQLAIRLTRQLITIHPDIQSGTAVFFNTRVPVKNLFDYVRGQGFLIKKSFALGAFVLRQAQYGSG
jgi:hypothetical protein